MASSAVFSAWFTMVTLWSIRSTVVAVGVTDTSAGLVRYLSASSLIARGMVAEKNRVCRLGGTSATIRFSAWMKPRSSIWSASSRTRISSSRRLSARWSMRSSRRPGRGDEHVEAARDGAHALVVGHAAEDDADREAHELAIGFGAGGDLRGELARRRKHQHADLARLGDAARRRRGGRARAA